MNTRELLVLIVISWIFIGIKSLNLGLPIKTYETICITLLITLGLLHGAFDLHLKIKSSSIPYLHTIPRIFPYTISFIVLFLLSFYFLKMSLLIFIIISSYHFGEQNLKLITNKRFILNKTLQLSYGLFVLSLILSLNFEEANLFLETYGGFIFSKNLIHWFLLMSGVIEIGSTLFLIIHRQLSILIGCIIQFALLSLYFCFLYSSLLTGFTFYFIVWHSLPSIRDQVQNNYTKIHIKSILMFIKRSIIIWIASILALFVTFFLIQNPIVISRIFLTIGIAGTIPHIYIISRIKNRY